MPSASDFYHELQGANVRLEQIKGELLSLKASVDSLVTLEAYANDALYQNARQNETIICILEHISKHTCTLVNEAAVQTRLQRSIEESVKRLAALTAAAHAEAALVLEREEQLKQQIEKCCPPPEPDPPCHYERCKAPDHLKEPPRPPQPPVIERTGRQK